MTDPSAPTDNAEAVDTLRRFELRCDQLLHLLDGKKALTQLQRSDISAMYRSLKDDLKAASKALAVFDGMGRLSLVDQLFTYPAIRAAALALAPAINSDPIRLGWYGAVYSAHLELSNALAGLEAARRGD